MSTATTPTDPLRADAEHNRRALVEAARQVFSEQGLGAPLDEIARRAGVGNATLYRRFPTRSDLMAAVFVDRVSDHLRIVEDALAQPDPWTGFRGCVMAICAMQAADRGLADLLSMSVPEATDIEAVRRQAHDGFVELARRARVAGALRDDFVLGDLLLLLMANAGLIHRTAEDAPDAWLRFVAVVLDGLRAEAATPSPPTPDLETLRRAMRSQAATLGRRGARP